MFLYIPSCRFVWQRQSGGGIGEVGESSVGGGDHDDHECCLSSAFPSPSEPWLDGRGFSCGDI